MGLKRFIKELKVTDRKEPLIRAGTPTINGWNVWPKNAKTFVPGKRGILQPEKELGRRSNSQVYA